MAAITLSRLLAYFIQVHKKHAPPIATTMAGLTLLNEISKSQNRPRLIA